ncbi:sacsin N-terminal ATP-binding-like domain-containing protein [Polaribacter sp.]
MSTYKEKFDASESKAHNQNIATKILRDMDDLRAKAGDSPTASRRWVWELIQNAKDVAPADGIKIRISFEKDLDDFVKFEHNGKPFTADNIRFLIEQVSSKDRDKNEDGKRKNTGKFGTGFLTTHLLSGIVEVNGVAKEPELDYRKFKLILDRSGEELEEIIEAVNIAKVSVENLDVLDPYKEYLEDEFNTSFLYFLNNELNIRIAENGMRDLESCLPYAMSFVEEIDSIKIVESNKTYKRKKFHVANDNLIEFIEVYSESDKITIAKLTSGFTNIAIPVKIDGETISIIEIDNNIPKLFCDFPLIGSEVFPFPVVINNPNFNPTDPRDGVFLNNATIKKVEENKEIVGEALSLYYQLLKYASSNKWDNLHLLAKIKSLYGNAPEWLSEPWYNENLLKPIRKELLHAEIVVTADGETRAMLQEDGRKLLWFPYSNKKEIRDKIWEIANFWFPYVLPRKSEIELWYKLIWDDCGKLTLDQLSDFIQQRENLEKLQEVLKEKDAVEWLNVFYEVLQLDEKEFHTIIDKKLLVPNQNGILVKKSKLSHQKGAIEDIFKDILEDFGNEIRDNLVEESIELDFESSIDQSFIIKEIVSEINEKANNREVAKKHRGAFNKILAYFRQYPEKSKNLFPSIYRNRHLLYDDDEIANNFDKAEQLDDLLSNFNVTSADELRSLLEAGKSTSTGILPITEDILVSMGITSVEEWTKALEDKNLEQLYAHNPVPSTDMFVFAQSHIKRARQNVIDHLESLENYDLEHMEEIATTVLAGIKKEDREISIVFRPAYNGEVIIYYGSERDILDYEESELWVDTGDEVKKITLGHILKSAAINKFPI